MLPKYNMHKITAQVFNIKLLINSLALAFIIALITAGAYADENLILGARILSETTNEITLSIKYSYSGDKGKSVFMNAVMGDAGKSSLNYAVRPGKIEKGIHEVKVVLGVKSGAPDIFSTSQLIASMYVGGGKSFLKQSFEYSKTWAKANASLKPAGMMLTKVNPVVIPAKLPSMKQESTSYKSHRILPNGKIKIITKEDDSPKVMVPKMSAQPPTPPTAPPDTQHENWMNYESDRLFFIIAYLVEFDEESINNYLKNEGEDLSLYEQITARTRTIEILLAN